MAPTVVETATVLPEPDVTAPEKIAETSVETTPATLVPEPTLTATPVRIITLAVPEQWAARTEMAVALLKEEPPSYIWQIVPEGSEADIQLLEEEGQLKAFQEPIVLAVPFTTDWENTTLENGETILAQGHESVTVMPWRELPPTYKALRINGFLPIDQGYPFQDEWWLKISPGFKEAGAELQAALQQVSSDPVVHLVAVGDIMLDRSLGYAIEKGNIEYPFEDVLSILKNADITVGNLESSLGDTGQPSPKRYQFRAPVGAAESLAAAGFDVLSLANNHAMDFGPEALKQGIELLHAQGIQTAGAGNNREEAHTPQIIESQGLKLAFLSYVNVPVEASTGFDTAVWTATDYEPGLAWAETEEIMADVQEAKKQSDLVIVLLHSGFEYVEAPSEAQMAAAKAAVDAGADLVIGHHAHILQGIEYYKDGVIIYGTGNFAFEIDGDPQTAIFDIWLDKDGVRQLDFQPAVIQFGGQPRLADDAEAAVVRSQVFYLTNVLNAK